MAVVHFVLAATSKTPFYIAGGVLALWAVVLAAIGLNRDRFPGSAAGGRGVMALSLVLMLGAMATAVATASKPANEGKSQLKPVPAGGLDTIHGPSAPAPAASAPAAPSNTIAIKADPQALKFDVTKVTAKAGKDTIAFDNPSQTPHNVTIETSGGKQVGGTKTLPNGKTTASVTLKPGTYTFFCAVPGHRQAGMQGTLTVK